MNTYRTSQIAAIIGVHPNTVRLYEKWELIPKPERQNNGYRIYTDMHIEQMKLIKIALRCEIVHNGIRKRAINIIKTSAAGEYDEAIHQTEEHKAVIIREINRAKEAIAIVENMIGSEDKGENSIRLTRKQTAELLNVTIDTLRNWEMNGLLSIKRKDNGYRVYNEEDIKRLKVIYVLRCADFSLSAILRSLKALENDPKQPIMQIIDRPTESEYIVSQCDKLLSSLGKALSDAELMLDQLKYMRNEFS